MSATRAWLRYLWGFNTGASLALALLGGPALVLFVAFCSATCFFLSLLGDA